MNMRRLERLSDIVVVSEGMRVGVKYTHGAQPQSPGDVDIAEADQALAVFASLAHMVQRGEHVGPYGRDEVGAVHPYDDAGGKHAASGGWDTVETASLSFSVPAGVEVISEQSSEASPSHDTVRVVVDALDPRTGMSAEVHYRVNAFYSTYGTALWHDEACLQLMTALQFRPGMLSLERDYAVSDMVDGWGPAIRATMLNVVARRHEYAYVVGVDGPGWMVRLSVLSAEQLSDEALSLGYEMLSSVVVSTEVGTADAPTFYPHGHTMDLRIASGA